MTQSYSSAYRYALIVALGGFVFGLDAAIISGTVRYIASEFSLSDIEIGTVVGAPSLGAILALFFAGKVADSWGRKNTLLAIAVLYVISATGSALATGFWSLTLARMLGGLAFCSLSLASMYIGEVAPAHLRGKLVSCNQLNIVIGLSAAYFINYYLVLNASEASPWLNSSTIWRIMLGSELIPAVAWAVMLLGVPESPRWLVMKGKHQRAQRVLNLLYKDKAQAQSVFNEIRSNLSGDSDLPFKQQVIQLFTPKMRRVMALGLTVAVVQGATGMNAILFYAPTVFEQIGFGVNASFQQALYIGLTGLVFTIFALLLIDRVGRRPLMIAGLIAAIFSHGLCWFAFNKAHYEISPATIVELEQQIDVSPLEDNMGRRFSSDTEFKDFLAQHYPADELRLNVGHIIESAISINPLMVLIGILGFIAAFHISLGPIMWVLFSEIFPNSLRSAAVPFFALITSISSYLVQQFFPWQLARFGAADTFMMYAGIGLIGLLFTHRLLPETKGKSIEQLEHLLSSEPVIRRSKLDSHSAPIG